MLRQTKENSLEEAEGKGINFIPSSVFASRNVLEVGLTVSHKD